MYPVETSVIRLLRRLGCIWEWGHSWVGKMVALEAQTSEFTSPGPTKKQDTGDLPCNPTVGRWRGCLGFSRQLVRLYVSRVSEKLSKDKATASREDSDHWAPHACVYTLTSAHMCIYTDFCTHVHTRWPPHTELHTHVHTNWPLQTCSHTLSSTYMCTHIDLCTHVHMLWPPHTEIHTHVHTHWPPNRRPDTDLQTQTSIHWPLHTDLHTYVHTLTSTHRLPYNMCTHTSTYWPLHTCIHTEQHALISTHRPPYTCAHSPGHKYMEFCNRSYTTFLNKTMEYFFKLIKVNSAEGTWSKPDWYWQKWRWRENLRSCYRGWAQGCSSRRIFW